MSNPPKPRVKIYDNAMDSVAIWGSSQETSLQLVHEAHRRFMEITSNDSRAAAALTLAWASLESRP